MKEHQKRLLESIEADIKAMAEMIANMGGVGLNLRERLQSIQGKIETIYKAESTEK